MFIKYPKIHRFGKEETTGILCGNVVVQEKIDGANVSVWQENGQIKCGSRTRELLDDDFNGFVTYVNNHKGIKEYLKLNPTHRLYGEWLCLSGDTIIKKVSGGRGRKGNYMTLKEMYDYSFKIEKNRKKTSWERYGMPSIFSLDHEKDLVLPNKIKKIVKTGIKKSYKITLRNGYNIKSSEDHKFLTQTGYVEVKNLDTKFHVLAFCKLKSERTNDRLLGVGSKKIIKLQKEFIKSVAKCKNCKTTNCLELDHIDENWQNNDISNWQVLCSSCHRVKSGLAQNKTKPFKKGYAYSFDKIKSIEYVGEEEMYDIEMGGSENVANFVANNFIVHNCRHTISYNETAYRKMYLFDILIDGKFADQSDVLIVSQNYNLEYPQIFGEFKNPNEEEITKFAGKTNLGAEGEGVVIKNLSFINKFGDLCYAKVVTQKFKESNALKFDGNNKQSDTYWEMYVVNKYCTLARVQKIMNKLQPEINETLTYKHIPRIVEICYHDMITEEIYEIQKKVEKINFRNLKNLAGKKFAQIFKDIIEGKLDRVTYVNYIH